jgi:hypothetical protein
MAWSFKRKRIDRAERLYMRHLRHLRWLWPPWRTWHLVRSKCRLAAGSDPNSRHVGAGSVCAKRCIGFQGSDCLPTTKNQFWLEMCLTSSNKARSSVTHRASFPISQVIQMPLSPGSSSLPPPDERPCGSFRGVAHCFFDWIIVWVISYNNEWSRETVTVAYLEPFSIGNDAISSSLSLGHAWLHILSAEMILVFEAKMIRDVFSMVWKGRWFY